LILIR